MLREQVLAPDGPWRKVLQKQQAKAADHLQAICQRAAALAESALPVDRVRLRTAGLVDMPRYTAPLRMDRVEQLVSHAAFLKEVRLYAPAAGFGAARDNAAKALTRHFDQVRNGLLDVRLDPSRGPNYASWVRALATLIATFEDEDASRLFERRAAA
jgi:hypothetical protein